MTMLSSPKVSGLVVRFFNIMVSTKGSRDRCLRGELGFISDWIFLPFLIFAMRIIIAFIQEVCSENKKKYHI